MSEIQVLRDGETHVFTTPRVDGWSSHIRVNGLEVKPGEQLTTTGVPLVEVWQEITVKVIAKSLVDGRPDLTMDDWEARDRELSPTERIEYTNGEHGIGYRDLDAEYEHKKFKAAYQIITRKDLVRVREVGLDIREKEVAPSPFVTMCRHLGEEATSRFAVYNAKGYVVHVIQDILAQNGYVSEDDPNAKTKAGAKYKLFVFRDHEASLHIAGSQVFNRDNLRPFRDNLEQIAARMQADRQEVEQKLGFYLAGQQRGLNAYAMSKKLEAIRTMVHKIDSKVATSDDKRALLLHLENEIAKLKALDIVDDGGDLAPALAPGPGRNTP